MRRRQLYRRALGFSGAVIRIRERSHRRQNFRDGQVLLERINRRTLQVAIKLVLILLLSIIIIIVIIIIVIITTSTGASHSNQPGSSDHQP